jgi:hypothetical protein
MSNDVRVATVYLQVEGRQPGHGYDYGTRAVVRAFTTKKPETVRAGCIVVKLKLRIPKEAWEPFAPEAVVEVPADLVQKVIAVEAVAASG